MRKINTISILLLLILGLIPIKTLGLPTRLTSSDRITYLYKNDTTSPKVLAGVAIVRFKSLDKSSVIENKKYKSINSIAPADYRIIDFLLSSSNAVSNIKERIKGLSKEKLATIKSLEEKLKRTAIVEFNKEIDVLYFCKYIQNQDISIEIAEPYYVPELLMEPNDPKVQLQDMLKRIDIFSAWDISEASEDVLIGVSDCGVNWQHEDLVEGIAINEKEIPNDGIDNDNNGYIDDYYGYNFAWEDDDSARDDVTSPGGHGTEVAGILAARVNNGIGIAGVANRCRIVPIKTSSRDNYNSVIYGYQSMIYAAVRGCKVLNCSWGIPDVYSVTNQLVVDYITACDVALIAAGGNVGSNGAGNYSSFYPAGYFGALGVGAVGKGDVVGNVVYGVPVRIMAPSNGNWTVTSNNAYKQVTSGSSFATPVVSGVVGLIRSAKPSLSPLEAIEIARRSGNILTSNGKNEYDSAFIPLQVNARKALVSEIEKLPAVVLVEHFFTDRITGKKRDRVSDLDTLELNLVLGNILADAKNISLNFSLIFSLDENAYKFIEPVMFIGDIKKGERKKYKTSVIIQNANNCEAIFKVYISGTNINDEVYSDNFKMRLATTNQVTTFYNEIMSISVGDAGSIGYSTPTGLSSFGAGFSHKTIGNFIYEGGVMASAGLKKVVSVNLDTDQRKPDRNSFVPVKKLEGKENNINIIEDSKAKLENKIGVEIQTKYLLPQDSSTAMKMIITAKNISGKTIKDFVIGHYYDWDVGKSNARNRVEFCSECIPYSIGQDYAAVEIAYDTDLTAFVGSLVYYPKYSNSDYFVLPQAAGIDNMVEDIFNRNIQVQALTSGKNKQVDKVTDISYVVGLHFLDDFKANETRECIICSAVEETKEKLIKSLEKCAKEEYGAIDNNFQEETDEFAKVYVSDKKIHILLLKNELVNLKAELYNFLGEKILTKYIDNKVDVINIDNLSQGAYLLRINNQNNSYTKTIIYKK